MSSHIMGWCNDGIHDKCIKKYERFYIGQKKVKRKTVESIVFTGEFVECMCKCHNPEAVEKPKKRATRRKK